MNSEDEIYDVVDMNDCVVSQATRKEIHLKNLLHRSVHILVFNPQGDLFLQKRAMTKDENPGFWDTSSAGHVDAGEDYQTAAHRELMEELDISEPLNPFMKLEASRETHWEHVRAYTCTTKQTITINRKEIQEGRYWTLNEISQAFSENNQQFTSTFKIIFFNYLKENG